MITYAISYIEFGQRKFQLKRFSKKVQKLLIIKFLKFKKDFAQNDK